MTRVTDERGRVLLRNGYDVQKMLRTQQFENGANYFYRYQWSGDNRYIDSVIITLPDGTEENVKVADKITGYVRNYLQ